MKLLIDSDRIVGLATDDYTGPMQTEPVPDDFDPARMHEYVRRGLTRPHGRVWVETSPQEHSQLHLPTRLTRPHGRVWVETDQGRSAGLGAGGLTRPHGRVWVETAKTT
ncbi:MAG: hypothetical protein N2690_00990 [Rhodocyclaceae bacterium]|nr:hypothetical protein [Rhodocyclaceae bacterium]